MCPSWFGHVLLSLDVEDVDLATARPRSLAEIQYSNPCGIRAGGMATGSRPRSELKAKGMAWVEDSSDTDASGPDRSVSS